MAFFHSNFMLQTDDHHHNNPPSILPPSNCNPQDFHGLLGKRPSVSFSGMEDGNNTSNQGEDEFSDDGSQLGEKKRRLNMEQVRTLEKHFELGNKLEPERKMQLARTLGLQPRQIAIWFQNRRARWKTKQLEKDYDHLKRQFEEVKAENDLLLAQNQKLNAQIKALNAREPTESINLNKETEGSCSNRSENTSEIKLDMSTNPPAIDSPSLSTNPSRSFFPSSSSSRPGIAVAVSAGGQQHLFQQQQQQCPTSNNINHNQNVKEETLCNMFCPMDDQTGFWPWLEHHHFN